MIRVSSTTRSLTNTREDRRKSCRVTQTTEREQRSKMVESVRWISHWPTGNDGMCGINRGVRVITLERSRSVEQKSVGECAQRASPLPVFFLALLLSRTKWNKELEIRIIDKLRDICPRAYAYAYGEYLILRLLKEGISRRGEKWGGEVINLLARNLRVREFERSMLVFILNIYWTKIYCEISPYEIYFN